MYKKLVILPAVAGMIAILLTACKSEKQSFTDTLDISAIYTGNSRIRYYFPAAWEKEHNGIQSSADFKDYLGRTASGLSGNPEVKLK